MFEAAERLDGATDHPIDVGLAGDVAADREHASVVGREPFRRGLDSIRLPVGEDHRRAGLGQTSRACEAESLGSTRDERSPTAQIDEAREGRVRRNPRLRDYRIYVVVEICAYVCLRCCALLTTPRG